MLHRVDSGDGTEINCGSLTARVWMSRRGHRLPGVHHEKLALVNGCNVEFTIARSWIGMRTVTKMHALFQLVIYGKWVAYEPCIKLRSRPISQRSSSRMQYHRYAHTPEASNAFIAPLT